MLVCIFTQKYIFFLNYSTKIPLHAAGRLQFGRYWISLLVFGSAVFEFGTVSRGEKIDQEAYDFEGKTIE